MVLESQLISENIEPTISVITVVFNDKNNLEATIKSVINQSYSSIEYIIIDGGSTDGTKTIIQQYESKIDYWKSENDNGVYDAMNKGLNAANGDYIIFMNAGDSFTSREMLKEVIKEIKTNKWPDVIYGSANILSENGKFIKELKPLHFTRLNLTLFGTRTVCHQSILVNRSIAPFYSKDYQLKAELAWYYDILDIKPHPILCKINLPISNYLLGGLSDTLFSKEIIERLKVICDKNGIFGCFIGIPFLLIPVIFRLKRKLFCRK